VLRGAVLPAGFWRSPSSPGAALLEPLMSSLPTGAVVALDPPLAFVFLWSAAQPASASPHSAIQSSLLMKISLRKKVLGIAARIVPAKIGVRALFPATRSLRK
jgi:hypothetical protein